MGVNALNYLLISDLSKWLCVMLEMHYLPDDCEEVQPEAVAALKEARKVLASHDHGAPSELVHWLTRIGDGEIENIKRAKR